MTRRQRAVDAQPAADAGAEHEPHDDAVPVPRAAVDFGKGERHAVVDYGDRPPARGGKIGGQRAARGRDVGRPGDAGVGVDDAGNADADGQGRVAGGGPKPVDLGQDGVEEGVVAVQRRGNAADLERGVGAVEEACLDLGPAEVDAADHCACPPCRRGQHRSGGGDCQTLRGLGAAW